MIFLLLDTFLLLNTCFYINVDDEFFNIKRWFIHKKIPINNLTECGMGYKKTENTEGYNINEYDFLEIEYIENKFNIAFHIPINYKVSSSMPTSIIGKDRESINKLVNHFCSKRDILYSRKAMNQYKLLPMENISDNQEYNKITDFNIEIIKKDMLNNFIKKVKLERGT